MGLYLKKTYGKFVGNYTSEKVYVRSTNFDRTLATAEAVLAGLFPPPNPKAFNVKLLKLWQPIPIHTVPIEQDHLLCLFAHGCPAFQRLAQEQFYNSKEYKDLNRKSQDLLKYLSQHYGERITSIKQITGIYDNLWIETQYNNL